MKYSRIVLLACLAALALASASCAVSSTADDSAQDRVLKAWMNVNYPGIQPRSTGAYVLSLETGSGASVGDSAYVFAHYNCTDLEGNIASTNKIDLVEQLGTFEYNGYYGSDIWRVDQGYIPTGLEEVIKNLRVGGKATVAIPVSASYTEASVYNAFPESEEANVIYTIAIDDVIYDIKDREEEMLKAFRDANFPGLDTLRAGLYMKKLVECPDDTIPGGNTIKVRYIGSLVETRAVFDTNVQDSAKLYRLYDAENTYEGLEITMNDDEESFFENNSVISGFGYALMHMNYGETAICFFRSDLGYKASGSGNSIPEYAPLCFWLHVEEDN